MTYYKFKSMFKEYDFHGLKENLHDSKLFYAICTDIEGNYSYINERYKNAFSHIGQDVLNKPYHITMHPDDIKVCELVGGKCYETPTGHFLPL